MSSYLWERASCKVSCKEEAIECSLEMLWRFCLIRSFFHASKSTFSSDFPCLICAKKLSLDEIGEEEEVCFVIEKEGSEGADGGAGTGPGLFLATTLPLCVMSITGCSFLAPDSVLAAVTVSLKLVAIFNTSSGLFALEDKEAISPKVASSCVLICDNWSCSELDALSASIIAFSA